MAPEVLQTTPLRRWPSYPSIVLWLILTIPGKIGWANAALPKAHNLARLLVQVGHASNVVSAVQCRVLRRSGMGHIRRLEVKINRTDIHIASSGQECPREAASCPARLIGTPARNGRSTEKKKDGGEEGQLRIEACRTHGMGEPTSVLESN
jgi:hypothetical protein